MKITEAKELLCPLTFINGCSRNCVADRCMLWEADTEEEFYHESVIIDRGALHGSVRYTEGLEKKSRTIKLDSGDCGLIQRSEKSETND